MNWLTISLTWYFFLFFLGLTFFPLTKKVFSKFNFDHAYPFAKTLAIVFLSYSIYFLATLKIIPFERIYLFLIIFLFTLINWLIYKKANKEKNNANFRLLIFEEILFFIAFIFLVFIRGQESSIRGLEKFMDFGFINSILRSKYFPPIDIWLSADNINPKGYPINYYYFGHLTAAFLIKLIGIKPSIGYNLILATIFAQGITLVFSLIANIIFLYQNKISYLKIIFVSLLGSFVANLGGNLHTIYVLTSGYPNENPVPFWQIFSFCNTLFPNACQTLGKTLYPYWYPNATRFIPYTIHEFPSYSYVVADLHGHVFDIPFVLITLALIFQFYFIFLINKKKSFAGFFPFLALIGFFLAINYMTNAFDGPIYFLFLILLFLIVFKSLNKTLTASLILFVSFLIFSFPFSTHFKPFVSGIGVNCSPEFLTKIGRMGPFLFEKNNCQISPLWMLFTLWGFFWVNFIIFLLIKRKFENQNNKLVINFFIFFLFAYSTFLIFIPEFFYIKDIYPAHFRANTMFKLGYQAFIMMAIASAFVFYLIKKLANKIYAFVFGFFFIFIFIYPFFAFPSYYGNSNKTPELDGEKWLENLYPEDKEIIEFINKNIKDQPVILEAQGDSYSDFERISAYTGLPTVAGWWVHEWLWRGSADTVGKRIPDIQEIYEGKNLEKTINLIKKYQIKYIVVSQMEHQKYPNLSEDKFNQIGEKIFESSNKLGALYQIKIR